MGHDDPRDADVNLGRNDPNSESNSANSKYSREKAAEQIGTGAKTISRYIRLTFLSDKLVEMVDAKKLSVVNAEQLSFLDAELFTSDPNELMALAEERKREEEAI